MIFLQSLLDSITKEIRWLKSSRWDFAMITWVPVLSVLFIWWTFSAIIPYKLPIGVLDQDHSTISRQVNRYINASPILNVTEQYTDIKSAETALRRGDIFAVVILPYQLQQDIKSGHPSNVVLNVNAQYGTHSKLIQSNLQNVIGTIAAGIKIQLRMSTINETPSQAHDNFSPLDNNLVPLFNIASDYQLFLGTAAIPALLHILAMTAGAYTAGRELRDKTMGLWLNNITPTKISRTALSGSLLGKLLPSIISFTLIDSWTIYLIQSTHIVSFSSLIVTLIALILLTTLSIVLGALFSLLTMSLRTALSGTGILTAPAFAFSGTGFPLLAMSSGAYTWAMCLPYTHYGVLQVKQMQMGTPAHYALPTIVGYCLATAIIFILTTMLLMRAYKMPERWGKR